MFLNLIAMESPQARYECGLGMKSRTNAPMKCRLGFPKNKD